MEAQDAGEPALYHLKHMQVGCSQHHVASHHSTHLRQHRILCTACQREAPGETGQLFKDHLCRK